MAVTYNQRDKLLQDANANGSIGAYKGLSGVSGQTAQQVAQKQQDYQPSADVTNAQNRVQQALDAKPQGYNSKYQGKLDSILQQIENPEKFKYSFNDDELFKYYADLYTQKGQQASMDAMGQAVALTGGYANSAAQQVGQQAYQQYLTELYDRGMDLRDRAYQQWLNEQQDQKDLYGMLQQADETEYGRYRDTMADWQNELAFAQNAYESERGFDYNRYNDALNYWTDLAKQENASWNQEQNRAEDARQFDLSFEEGKREYDQDYARRVYENDRDYDRAVYQDDRDYDRRVYEDDRDYSRHVYENDRDFSENVRQFDATLAENQRQFDADLKYKYDALEQDDKQFLADLAYKYAGLEQDQKQFDTEMTYKYDALKQDQSQFESGLKLDYDKLAQDQSQFEAGLKLDYDKLAQEQSQFEADLDWDKAKTDKGYAKDYCMAILAAGGMPSDELLRLAGLTKADAEQMRTKQSSGTGTGTNPKGKKKQQKTPKQRGINIWEGLNDQAEDPDKKKKSGGTVGTSQRMTDR